jgi:hypothetical protein
MRTYEDNIKMDLKGMRSWSAYCFCVAKDRLQAGFCEHGNELSWPDE